MLDYLRGNLNFSLRRVFLFLFFNCAYVFFSFWITFTLLTFIIPFTIFGLAFYVFVVLFHIAINRIVARSEVTGSDDKAFQSPALMGFLLFLIVFAVLYIFGVRWMQDLVIIHMSLPPVAFKIVSWGLFAISTAISFFLSFINRKYQTQEASQRASDSLTFPPNIQNYSAVSGTTESQLKPQIKSRFWAGALILIFLFVFLAFGIFVFAAISKSAERQGLSVYQLFFDSENSATAKLDKLTADWRTYYNGYYVFEMRYPKSGWDVYEEIAQEKGGSPINLFALRSAHCQIALEPSGGKGLGPEWILEDQPVTINGRIYESRLFYLGDKNHLKWVSVYSFPNHPATDLVLRADQNSQSDIDLVCLSDFRQILTTVKFLK